jgi:error-prone DNA polymerase
MGFYHPATLVKDAQRRGARFARIDVQHSDWECTVEPDGAIRLGLRYVTGLREEQGRVIEVAGLRSPIPDSRSLVCPKCGCDDPSMVEVVDPATPRARGFCSTCAADWSPDDETGGAARPRFASVEALIARAGLRRDELATLAEIGALNAFGYDRRTALWQIERAVREPGELFKGEHGRSQKKAHKSARRKEQRMKQEAPRFKDEKADPTRSPLAPMTPDERVVADYAGTGLTIGPHPVAFRRQELALRGVLRAIDLPRARNGRRVRVAGTVITRQRPGTAKGFVFLTLEDETGVANIIVRPDVFAADRVTILERPFLLVEGVLQLQDGVTSVKAERFHDFAFGEATPESRDFY